MFVADEKDVLYNKNVIKLSSCGSFVFEIKNINYFNMIYIRTTRMNFDPEPELIHESYWYKSARFLESKLYVLNTSNTSNLEYTHEHIQREIR